MVASLQINGGSPNALQNRETPDRVLSDMISSVCVGTLPDDVLFEVAKHLEDNDIKNMMLGLKLVSLSRQLRYSNNLKAILFSILSGYYKFVKHNPNENVLIRFTSERYIP